MSSNARDLSRRADEDWLSKKKWQPFAGRRNSSPVVEDCADVESRKLAFSTDLQPRYTEEAASVVNSTGSKANQS